MSNRLLNHEEYHSSAIQKLREAYEQRLEQLRNELENRNLGHDGTQYKRGRIAETKNLLALIDPHQPVPAIEVDEQ